MKGRRNYWKDREAELREAVAAGVTMAQLGQRYGVKENTVNTACWRLGIRVSASVKGERCRALKAVQWADANYRRAMIVASVKGALSRVSWCPAHYMPAYRALANKCKADGGAAYARSVIEADIIRDLRRALKAIAAIAAKEHAEQRRQYRSFEAELERVRTGQTRAVERIALVRADHDYSLTGNTLANA